VIFFHPRQLCAEKEIASLSLPMRLHDHNHFMANGRLLLCGPLVIMRKRRIRSEHCNNCGYDFTISLQEVNYCPVCGQENHNPRLTLKYYAEQLVENIFHFDSKTIRSVFTLLFKPGAVTNVYLNNRRKQYSSPFKLFFFGLVVFLFSIIFVNQLVYNQVQNSDKVSTRQYFGALLLKANDSATWTFDVSPFVKHNIYVIDIRKLVFSEKIQIGQWLNETGFPNNWYNRLFCASIRKYDRSEMSRIEFDEKLNRFRYFLLIATIPIIAFVSYLLFYRKGLLFFDTFLFSAHYNAATMFWGIIIFFVYVLPWQFIFKRANYDTAFVLLCFSYLFNFFPAAKRVFGFGWLSSFVRSLLVASIIIPLIYISQMLAQAFWV
jgi:hypothetical protein